MAGFVGHAGLVIGAMTADGNAERKLVAEARYVSNTQLLSIPFRSELIREGAYVICICKHIPLFRAGRNKHKQRSLGDEPQGAGQGNPSRRETSMKTVLGAAPVRTRIHPEKIVDVGLGKTTVDANNLTIDPAALRTHEKCNHASYVFWCA